MESRLATFDERRLRTTARAVPTLSGDNCASYDQGRLPKPDQPMHGRNDHKQRLRGITWLFPAHGMAETAGLPPLPKALKSLGGKGW